MLFPRSNLASVGRQRCLPVLFRRHESSARRTKLKLNIPPTESMLLTANSPAQSHIIYNPPSALPSTLHTPLKFIPKADIRHQLVGKLPNHNGFGQAEATTLAVTLPAPMSNSTPSYHLSKDQVLEMKKLRSEDPGTWTRAALAKKFNCSNAFVGIVTEASTKYKRMHEMKIDAIRATWGWKKTKARMDRARRRQLWLMGA